LPAAYSYAYDDHTSTYTCKNKDDDTLTAYIVTFCGASEGPRITLPGSDTHSHLPDMSPTPLPTPVPTQTPVPAQTPVPHTPFNPERSGDVIF
ncbi:MAG TPA: thaumatin family protein, partial [Methanoregula sp.]|nr:thaumatin family protein [Methanoregula sp.]